MQLNQKLIVFAETIETKQIDKIQSSMFWTGYI